MSGSDALSQLLQVARALREWWWVALLVVVPIVVGAVWYAERLPSTYESSAIVLVEPRPIDGNISTSVVPLKGPSYVAYLMAPATIRPLAEDLGLEASEVRSELDASVEEDTGNITVTATSEDPERARDIASAAADVLVVFSDDDALLQAQLLAPAVVPDGPAGPPRRLIETAAVVVALGLGLVAALLADRRRPRIGSVSDVSALTSWVLLGRMPVRSRLPETPAITFADPTIGTAVRSLRVRLEPDLRRGHSLTITSSLPREGKSTVSSLLATSLARSGFSVVLIDGDLRRPRLQTWLEGWDGIGLAEVVRKRAAIEQALVPGWTENLTILPTRPDRDAGESLSGRLPSLLEELREAFDVVLVDAPPLLASDEARALAAGTDRVAVVVATGTPAHAVAEAEAALAGLRAEVVGYVLNRSTRAEGVYATYGYDS